MTNISRRLEQVVSKELQRTIIPIKVSDGILVGDVKIVSEGSNKHLWYRDILIYENVFLNAVAVKIANIVALTKRTNIATDNLYKADQEYGKWFLDSQLLRAQYQKSISNQDFERADTLWARYIESRDRAISAKNAAQALAHF